MHFSMTSLVLATVAIGQASAASIGHIHQSLHNHALRHTEFKRNEDLRSRGIAALTDSAVAKITKMGFKSGVNSPATTSNVWIGTDGPYQNEFTNASPDNLTLVVWGPAASWVAVTQPLITVALAPLENVTLSFANDASGAWTAIYPETEMSEWGQIADTWGEYTFNPTGVVDISREVNMKGRNMKVIGPTCTTDMDTCVFVCPSGDSCEFGYQLLNCDPATNPGAQFGEYFGAPSGGCGGLGSTAKLVTILGHNATTAATS